jgi:hypothetical protein
MREAAIADARRAFFGTAPGDILAAHLLGVVARGFAGVSLEIARDIVARRPGDLTAFAAAIRGRRPVDPAPETGDPWGRRVAPRSGSCPEGQSSTKGDTACWTC